MEKKKKGYEKADSSEKAAAKRKADYTGFGSADIIEATHDVEGITYPPRTAETREVYELILSAVHTALGDQAQDTVRSAADTVLGFLKNENMKDFDRKKEIEEVIGPVSGEQFAQLLDLFKRITDYHAYDEATADPDMERKEAEIDEEGGVAVLFDDEDQEEEEEEEEDYEIRDDTDEEDEREEREGEETAVEGEVQEEDIVIGGEASRKATSKAERDVVSPHSIDGFWVQRQISEIYPDPSRRPTKRLPC